MAGRKHGSAKKALFKSPMKRGKYQEPPQKVEKKVPEKEPPQKEDVPIKEQKKVEVPPPEPKKDLKPSSPPKPEITTSGDSPKNVWASKPKLEIDIDELAQRASLVSDHVHEHGLLFNLGELRVEQASRTVSVFAVDSITRKMLKTKKDLMTKTLSSLGVKVQAIIAGTSYAMWDVLLPTPEDAVALTKKHLEVKDMILRVEYLGRRKTTVTIYEVPSYLIDENLAGYFMKYGDLVAARHDGMRGEWSFDIMLSKTAFDSVPNFLDLEGRRLSVIVTGRKPACWNCFKTGHLSSNCPGKKAPVIATSKTRDTLPLPKSPGRKEASEAEPAVRTTTSEKVGVEQQTPPSPKTSSLGTTGNDEGEWLTAGKGGRKVQTAVPQSHIEIPTGTVGETPQSYAGMTRDKCVSPGKEKFEKLLKFKAALDAKTAVTTTSTTTTTTTAASSGCPRSTPPKTLKSPKPSPGRLMPPPKMTVLGHKGAHPPPLPTPPKKISPRPTPTTSTASTPKSSPHKKTPVPTPSRGETGEKITAVKRQRSPSAGSSEDELPSLKKKTPFGGGLHICKVEGDILIKDSKLPPKIADNLGALLNFKRLKDLDVEDPRNFPDAWVLSAIRSGRRSGPIMAMVRDAAETFGPIAALLPEGGEYMCEPGRVPIRLHPSLYRALKLTYPRDIGGLAYDGAFTEALGFASLSQTVGVLSPDMFSPMT